MARLLDEVIENREVVIIRRPNAADVVLIAASEVTGLLETIHLLRSPANAERLLTALDDALQGNGEPMNLEELRRAVGIEG